MIYDGSNKESGIGLFGIIAADYKIIHPHITILTYLPDMYLSKHTHIYTQIHIHLSIYLSTCLSIYLSILTLGKGLAGRSPSPADRPLPRIRRAPHTPQPRQRGPWPGARTSPRAAAVGPLPPASLWLVTLAHWLSDGEAGGARNK